MDLLEQMGHDIIFGYYTSQTDPHIVWICALSCVSVGGLVFINVNECRFMSKFAHISLGLCTNVCQCVSWLESRAGLRWAAADILVCFNPLANKTAGNHQKNTSSWTGRRAWGGRGEEERGEERRCVHRFG